MATPETAAAPGSASTDARMPEPVESDASGLGSRTDGEMRANARRTNVTAASSDKCASASRNESGNGNGNGHGDGERLVKIYAGKLFDPYTLQLLPQRVITVSEDSGLVLDVQPYSGDEVRNVDFASREDVVDLRAATVLPGLVDVHVHSKYGAIRTVPTTVQYCITTRFGDLVQRRRCLAVASRAIPSGRTFSAVAVVWTRVRTTS